MNRHFPKAGYTVLKGNPEEEILNYLKLQKNNPLVVLGAYQRGMVSRGLRPSMADLLMRNETPFIYCSHQIIKKYPPAGATWLKRSGSRKINYLVFLFFSPEHNQRSRDDCQGFRETHDVAWSQISFYEFTPYI